MDTKILEEVIEIFHKAKVSKLSVKQGDFEISLEKATIVSNVKEDVAMTEIKDISLAHIVKSPMVGCFYRANSPKDDPFVNAGDTVKEGETLCIIEAMKVMIEVKSEVSGTIKEVKQSDGDMVEFGQSLFVMER